MVKITSVADAVSNFHSDNCDGDGENGINGVEHKVIIKAKIEVEY